jgi:hypothetical protein
MAAFPDVVVVLPGVLGSVLERDGKEIWGLSAGALWRGITSGANTVRQLALEGDDPSVDDLGDGVKATKVIPDLHIFPGFWKIDGYAKTIDTLSKKVELQEGKNLFGFAYDWRRDNRVSAKALKKQTDTWLKAWRNSSGNADAKLVLIGHSMGGIVARYFLEVLDGWRDTRNLITFGTPYRGSLNALGFMANGYAKSIGPLKIDLSDTARSFTSLYQLLPTYRCVYTGGGEPVRITEAPGIPNMDMARASAALAFHQEIRDAQKANAGKDDYVTYGYRIFPVVGIEQPTFQSAMLAGGKLGLRSELGGKNAGGDGTVPRISAIPHEEIFRRREAYAAEAHASLQNFAPVLTQVGGVLSRETIDEDLYEGVVEVTADLVTLGLDMQDAYAAGPVDIKVKPSSETALIAIVYDTATGSTVTQEQLRNSGDGHAYAQVNLPPGSYRVTVRGDEAVSPVTDTFLVL